MENIKPKMMRSTIRIITTTTKQNNTLNNLGKKTQNL